MTVSKGGISVKIPLSSRRQFEITVPRGIDDSLDRRITLMCTQIKSRIVRGRCVFLSRRCEDKQRYVKGRSLKQRLYVIRREHCGRYITRNLLHKERKLTESRGVSFTSLNVDKANLLLSRIRMKLAQSDEAKASLLHGQESSFACERTNRARMKRGDSLDAIQATRYLRIPMERSRIGSASRLVPSAAGPSRHHKVTISLIVPENYRSFPIGHVSRWYTLGVFTSEVVKRNYESSTESILTCRSSRYTSVAAATAVAGNRDA